MSRANVLPASHERTERILTVATELLVRWGYKRVTIEDIATHAGVGTGTIYLHWKTKDVLFESVLLRELVAIWRSMIHKLEADPSEALLHRLLSSLLLLIKQRPVARALFTRDVEMLGKLSYSQLAQQTSMSDDWLSMLRDLGLLHQDVDIDTQTYAFGAIWTGFILVDRFATTDASGTLERQRDALSMTVRRTLEPPTPPSSDRLRSVVAPTLIQFFKQACEQYLEQIEHRMLPPRNLQASS